MVQATGTKRRYSTDLTDEQWVMIRPLVERERQIGRPTVVNLREVVNALLYLTRTGCQWRLRPTEAGGERGFDGGKKVTGRKRHILVETEGNLVVVIAHPANIADRGGLGAGGGHGEECKTPACLGG